MTDEKIMTRISRGKLDKLQPEVMDALLHSLNNGGIEIAVKTENGNIYLRKAQP